MTVLSPLQFINMNGPSLSRHLYLAATSNFKNEATFHVVTHWKTHTLLSCLTLQLETSFPLLLLILKTQGLFVSTTRLIFFLIFFHFSCVSLFSLQNKMRNQNFCCINRGYRDIFYSYKKCNFWTDPDSPRSHKENK